jgi:hypothetical protein
MARHVSADRGGISPFSSALRHPLQQVRHVVGVFFFRLENVLDNPSCDRIIIGHRTISEYDSMAIRSAITSSRIIDCRSRPRNIPNGCDALDPMD